MLVVDSSVVTELLLGTRAAAPIRARLGSESLHAPDLLTLEVASVLRRLLMSGEIDDAVAGQVLVELDQLGVELYGHTPLLARTLELRNSMSTYDASYVALAEGLDVTLVTCDARLAAAHGSTARVELLRN